MTDASGNTILTRSGTYFDFDDPDASVVTPQDIASALSKICRFTGHTTVFYSVAQHSRLASHMVPPEDALEALMHDAAEAYVGDVSRPLKHLLPDYKVIEKRVEAAIARKFELSYPWPASVDVADLALLKRERLDMMHPDGGEWPSVAGVVMPSRKIVPESSARAERMWLLRFQELTVERRRGAIAPDIYALVAEHFGVDREAAKTLVYRAAYGLGPE